MSGFRRIVILLILAATPLAASGCLPACTPGAGGFINPYSCAA